MVSHTLTPTEADVYEQIAKGQFTGPEIADNLGIGNSVVYDHVSSIESKLEPLGYEFATGPYRVLNVPDDDSGPVNEYQKTHKNNVAKQTITRKANQFFADIEDWKERVNAYPKPVADGGLEKTEDGVDLTLHITDSHFGDYHESVERTPDGEEKQVIFSSEIAEKRIRVLVNEFLAWANRLRENGYKIDTVHLLLGGDMVTNEAIYNGQPWDVDKNIKEQLVQTTALFEWVIAQLSEEFESVQVVMQHGNHGEFRVDGSSGQANADDFLYAFLDFNIRKSAFKPEDKFNNISIVKDEHEYYTNYFIRNGTWSGHLRHGQNTRGHVGTSSQKKKWGSWADEYDFDIANYGHHHQYKNEHYNGKRVFMGGTIAPPSEYADSMGEFGEPCGYMYASSDQQVVEELNFHVFN